MPTTARLVAAILLAAVGWVVADMVKAYIPPEKPVGMFSPLSAFFGLLVGWTFTGRKLEAKLGKSVGIGLASAALLVFWVTFVFAGYEMIHRSTRVVYDGPTEAVVDMFQIGVDYLKLAAQPDVIIALIFGGLIAGGITQWVAQRYR